ncbi:MAG: permease [Gemmatimonadetes bacterium]|nr:permease [Gemmatimonadota bacterium]
MPRFAWIEHARRDVVHAWRGLRRSPVFAVVVTLTLAIGIGANAAVLSIIDTAFVRKLPVPEPTRVVSVSSGDTRERPAARQPWSSVPDYLDLRARVRGVTGLALWKIDDLTLGDSLAGQSVRSALVSGNYFTVLGIGAERGRVIAADEDEPRGAHPVVVISHVMWQTVFAGDEQIVGRQLTIGKTKFTIVGVAPKGFTGLHPEGRTDLWLPYTMYSEATGRAYSLDDRAARTFSIAGRLESGVSVAAVQGSVDQATSALVAANPEADKYLTIKVAVRDRLTETNGQTISAFISFVLAWAMVALLHMVACTNVATLMLARAAARRQELGIRLCLGASRGRIVLQALAEPAILATLGAAGGLLFARWLTQLICQVQFLSAMDAGLDLRIVAIVTGVAVATALEFGLLPALQASRRDPLVVLRGTAGAGSRGERATSYLVAAQIAMSLVLIADAAVLGRTFQKLGNTPLGYDAQRMVVGRVTLDGKRTETEWTSLYESVMARAAAVPGVRRVVATQSPPLRPGSLMDEVRLPGDDRPAGAAPMQSLALVGPGYFSAIGARLLRGREFTTSDRLTAEAKRNGFDVAIVNESEAKLLWPGRDPLGQQLTLMRRKTHAVVVGVVPDIYDVTISATHPRVYFPLLESPAGDFSLVATTDRDPEQITGALRTAIGAATGAQQPPTPVTMQSWIDGNLSTSRLGGIGLGIFASIGLLLTAMGLYGLVAAWSAERRKELGIRLALGAPIAHIHRLLLTDVARLLVVGAVIGLAAVVGLVRIESVWWGPSVSLDAVSVLAVLVVLGVVTAVAAYLPSRRATKTSPAEVLRA